MLTEQLSPPIDVFDPGSFRDRAGRVLVNNDRVLRTLSADALRQWRFVCECRFFQEGLDQGTIIPTSEVDEPVADFADEQFSGQWTGLLEHQKLPFISYPYEWSFGMLRDAALLQLRLLQAALAEDAVLKDSTPYNVQFRGSRPVFIDVPSFTKLVPGTPWDGYRQFCQLYLYPLMLQAFHGIDFQPFLRGRLEGITPAQFSGCLSFRDVFRRGVLTHAYLHAKLERTSSHLTNVPDSLRASGFSRGLIEENVKGLIRTVSGLTWNPGGSRWADYDFEPSPVQTDGSAKEVFVRRIAAQRHWRQVWDFGCNMGRYSQIAAPHGDVVLAMDFDHLTIEHLYQRLQQPEAPSNILPLVFNIADPSPALGWRCKERRSLPERGRPDLVFCLALIHHLVIQENLLLPDVVNWLADLGGSIVIEFVDRADAQVQSLLTNRVDQFSDYSFDNFRSVLNQRFHILEEQQLPSGNRTLFYAEPKCSG